MVVAATGFFDGVHAGHRTVIRTLLDYADMHNGQSLVISFWPHPRVVLQNGARDFRLLSSIEEKKDLLQGLGVSQVEVLPFDAAFAVLTAEDYLKMMRERFKVDAVVLGYDNRFGSDGLDTERIASLARSMGFEAIVVPPVEVQGRKVSSTQIRTALSEGDVEFASRMLGRDYEVCGVVVGGKQMGRVLGFRTANLMLRDPLKAVPKSGVYLSRVWLYGRQFRAMSNVDRLGKIETHIFDFEEDIYGYDLRVSFERKIRDEIQFTSWDQLKNQLQSDEMSAKSLIFAEQ